MPFLPLGASLLALLSLAGCRPGGSQGKALDTSELAVRAARVEEALANPDSGKQEKPIARWVMPGALDEISGLTLTPDGRLFAHNDEVARIIEIDYRRGVVRKQFRLGQSPLRGDFEGITVAGQDIYLLSSNGTLYRFREGAEGARVPYEVVDTHLGRECEFEGVAFDPAINSLVLACKVVGTRSLQGNLVLYRWKLGDSKDRLSHLAVPLARAIGNNPWKSLHPSDLTLDPANGNYVLVSAQEEALVEVTPAGEVVSSRPLPKGHAHTEGVAITHDGILIISDEAGKRAAAITLYRRR